MTRPVITIATTWANTPKDFQEPDSATFAEGFQGVVAQPDATLREFPKASDQNWHMNRTDQALAHILNYGIPAWDIEQEYTQGAKCQLNGIDYICIQNNTGRSPDINRSEWAFYAPKRMGETFQHYGSSEPIEGWFLNGQTIVNGVNTHPEIASIANDHALITVSGNDLILDNITDFDRAIGNGTRGAGSFQGDAIRDITGKFMGTDAEVQVGGAFYKSGGDDRTSGPGVGGVTRNGYAFEASRVVPTIPANDATGSRPNNVAYHKCIYHGRYF